MIDDVTLDQQIGTMLIMGFQGVNEHDPEVEIVSAHLADDLLGGVILYRNNIKNSEQLKTLNSKFKQANPTCFISVDQEGGKVERLPASKGFQGFPSAKEVGMLDNASDIYKTMSLELASHFINLNFGPVADLDNSSKPCPVIGGLGRSYSDHLDIVVYYNKEFIEAHHQNGVLTALKHFPGHGFAAGDTHADLTDVTLTAKPDELNVFYEVIKQADVDMIMTAHIVNQNIDKELPVTLSPIALKTLLRDNGYNGVIISDDLHMGAIIKNFGFEESIVKAINAGCDILILSNNKLACKGTDFAPNVNMNLKVIDVVKEALSKGEIKQETLDKAYNRIQSLKLKLENFQKLVLDAPDFNIAMANFAGNEKKVDL